jgi:hypothetical protein
MPMEHNEQRRNLNISVYIFGYGKVAALKERIKPLVKKIPLS